MEFDIIPLVWALCGVLVVVFGYKLIKMWVVSRQDSRPHLQQRIADLKVQLEDQKKETQRWRGKYGHTQTKPTIEGEDPENPEGFIPKLMNAVGDLGIGWLKDPTVQQLIKDPELIKFLIQQAKDHPDLAKQFLSKFVKSKSNDPDSQSQAGQQSGIDFSQYA